MLRSWLLGVAAAASTVACGGAGNGDEVVVFAAASLTEAFGELGDAFHAAHPDTDVTLSFAGSSDLATQIVEGAPADVFASADLRNMDRLVDDAVVDAPTVFATNRAEIVVAESNPLDIAEVVDLATPGLMVVVCSPEVPCGSYAATIFDRAGVDVEPVSLERTVKSVVTKVALGEADAGIVYATDVAAAADRTDGVTIPAGLNVVAEYPIAATAQAAHPLPAAEFIDFVLGEEGQAILRSYGFGAP